MTSAQPYTSASSRVFRPFHFFLLALCLMGALVYAPAALAQNYNAVKSSSFIGGASPAWSLGQAEAALQPYANVDPTGTTDPNCNGNWTSSTFPGTYVSEFYNGLVPWNPSSPGQAGTLSVGIEETCSNPGSNTVVGEPASALEYICGGGTTYASASQDCEQGYWLQGAQPPQSRGKAGVTTPDPIAMGSGNMWTRETDFAAADPRLEFSRFYNSSAGNAADLSAFGIGWLASTDAHLVPLQQLDYPQPSTSNSSPVYSSPSAACTSGFGALQAADPTIYAGDTVQYIPPTIAGQNGSCELLSAQGGFIAYLPINGSGTPVYTPQLVTVGVGAVRDDGSQIPFYCTNGVCHGQSVSAIQLWTTTSGYTLIDEDGVTETYNAPGILLTRTWKDGYQLTLVHNGDGISSGDGTLTSITDNHGRALLFHYNANGQLASLNTPDGQTISYNYDGHGRLTSVVDPLGTRTYQYGNSSYPNALTGVVDQNTHLSRTWSYDSNGLANGNTSGTIGSTAINPFSIAYTTAPNFPNTLSPLIASAVVTDPLGTQRTFTFDNYLGSPQVAAISGPVCGFCGQAPSNTYNVNGYLQSSTDWNGNVTGYGILQDLLYERIDGQGSPVQRTTTLNWDPVLRNPLSTTVQDVNNNLVAQTTWLYNSTGEPWAQCQADPSVSSAISYACSNTGTAPTGVRRWVYSYCTAVGTNCPLVGLLLSVADPLGHTTSYGYQMSTTGSARAGDLATITNALGQVTTILSRDGAGRVLSMTDVNNVETDLAYNARGWLSQVAVRATNGTTGSGDHITTLAYDNVGNVTRITQPNGAYSNFTYDAANRLTDIADNLGDDIHYTLDAAGNRTEDDTRDPSGNLKRIVRRQFNAIGQLTVNANAALNGSSLVPNMSYAYDANGNANVLTDGRGTITNNSIDALNRISQIVQDPGTGAHINAATGITRDALDRTTKVTDPQGLNTTYQYDGLDDLLTQASPDTGTTTNTFDAAGNLLTRTDARGIVQTFSYDALNRVTGIAYASTSYDVSITHDTTQSLCNATTSFSVGHVTAITDYSGTLQFCYDRFGRVASKRQTIAGVPFTTSYSYDLAGHVTQLVTPNATAINYSRDSAGRITGVSYALSGQSTPTTVVSNVSYYPFGPVASITYGNGRVLTRSFDQDYVVSAVSDTAAGGLNLGFGRDVLGNLTQLTSGSAGNNLTYDALNRLTNVTDLSSNPIAAYSYDGTGNRLSKQLGTATAVPYTYPTSSHRLTAVGTTGRSYDAAGNTNTIGTGSTEQAFLFDATDRMAQFYSGGVYEESYKTNTLGQRVRKINPSNTAANQYTMYDESGQIVGDYVYVTTPTVSTQVIREMIWMDGLPVGVLNGTGETLEYVEPDQIGTPRTAINASSNQSVWNWSPLNDPFGETQPTGSITLNNRFPGQVYDSESGMNYNGMRDYDFGGGRYIESDPLGLGGGISTYGYVGGSPLNFADPLGLWAIVFCYGKNVYIILPLAITGDATNALRAATQGWNGPVGDFNVSTTILPIGAYPGIPSENVVQMTDMSSSYAKMWAMNDLQQGDIAYVHEVGHILLGYGYGDPNNVGHDSLPNSIMNGGSNPVTLSGHRVLPEHINAIMKNPNNSVFGCGCK